MSRAIILFVRFFTSARNRFGYLSCLGFYGCMSDEQYLKKEYFLNLGKNLDLKNPKTFNEKLQWLKLHDRKNIYTTMVDKYEVKKYVSEIIGEEYIIPTIGVYEKFDDIDFERLPNQFVMKCTHDSGGIVICKDKSKFDKKVARKKINKYLKRKYYYLHREWPYKNVKPKIIVEKYIEDIEGGKLTDYKLMCFGGRPELLYVSEGSHSKNQKIAFFDMNFRQLPIKRSDYIDYEIAPTKPRNFGKMVELAKELSRGIAHIRVDFYDIDGKIYFGEFTFCTGSGYIPFVDKKWDRKLGDMIDLSLVESE